MGTHHRTRAKTINHNKKMKLAFSLAFVLLGLCLVFAQDVDIDVGGLGVSGDLDDLSVSANAGDNEASASADDNSASATTDSDSDNDNTVMTTNVVTVTPVVIS